MGIKIRATLLDCLHRDESRLDPAALSVLTDEGWTALIEMATRHGVAPLLYQRLKTPNLVGCISHEVLDRLRGVYLNTAACNVRLYEELRPLLLALRAAGIPVIVLKGVYLAEQVYRNIALRPMSDIDLLVPASLAREAWRVMKELGEGYRLIYPATEALIPLFGKDFVCQKPGGFTPVEVHWTIRIADEKDCMDDEELWQNARVARIAELDTATLSVEDFLLHLCLHASYQHEFGFGLRALCDIAVFIERFELEIDWSALRARVLHHHWHKGVYLILYLASFRVGAAVPVEVLTALEPADLSVEVIEQAERRLFDASTEMAGMTLNTIGFFKPGRLDDRVRVLWRRLFPSREEMAYMYPIPPGSWVLYGYYLVRVRDLIRRHGAVAWYLLRGDRELAETVRRRAALREWLFKPDAQ
ncbi:MAG: nucleotidyltransferase family protein [Candidatus Competibacteraceae bacterium]|nr:nucleotidyltransferase family protein [Candidatus Competibacteraceae bacterium]MCB1793233.1 nucleotidyltransferase family protein [Candidatus Competibacteraceae bacterium]HPE72324.1 nucleotidyltransferase family protein [Candidatus Competibacter sp.]HRW64498.1 nucleotidyltransferase family protein [Candidatus Competibacter sp.]